MKKLRILIVALIAIGWYSCKKGGRIDHIDENAPAPAQVSDIRITAGPGTVIMTYKIPADPNLAYVKAIYEIRPGVFREAKASYYTDTISLVGFGDTLTHTVKLYSVGRNEKQSEPVLFSVKPLTPPIQSAYKGLDMVATFGGVNVTFINADKGNLSIVVMVDTTNHGTWAPATTYYTAQAKGSFAARGYQSREMKFGVFIRDRWNNKSDTLIKLITPFSEIQIPKIPFKVYKLPTDFWLGIPKYNVENLWDGIINSSENIFASADNISLPQWFTVDMNQKVVFSRMKIYQRTSYPYNAAWVQSFEIWGSNNPPADGSYTNWQLLGTFASVKPSGLPQPNYTASDMAYVTAGEEFSFPTGLNSVRFFRFKLTNTYGGAGKYQLGEFTFWGTIVP
ncbi:MAG TPA: DUF5000 domain-containing lipoprotein [Hanamia sp.]